MNNNYYGFNINLSTISLKEGVKLIKKSGGNLMQIFLTSPGKKSITKRPINELRNIKKYIQNNDMKVVVHSSYIHNMARDWDEYSWWILNLEIEIQYAYHIGAMCIVIHTGKQMNLSTWEAWNNMYTSLLYVHNNTLKYKDVKIFIETPSGEGTEMLYKIEDFSRFFRKFSISNNDVIKNRFMVCVDTCHVFAAGYDLKSKVKTKLFLEALDELIGNENIGLIHLNDSKKDVGSRVDRHEVIGKGYIGLDNLRYLFKYFKSYKIPIIIETSSNFKKDLDMLLS